MRRNRRSQCLFAIAALPFLFSLAFTVRAQSPPAYSPTPSSTPSLEKQFLRNILRDQKAIWTAPISISKEDAKWMVPAGVGTMALITTDRITGDQIAEVDRSGKTSRIFSAPGSTYSVVAVAASFYLVGLKRNDARARETGILSAQATIDTLIVVHALKGISQRGRPHTGNERSEFFEGGNSFPSGHSAQAWAVATIIAHEYHDRVAIQIAAYGIASAVSIARFTGGKHYLSDVLVGSALGYGIGRYVYQTHHRKTAPSDDGNGKVGGLQWPAISPQFNRRTRSYGVALTWNF